MDIMLVALGSAIGGVGRHLASLLIPYDPAAGSLPVATLSVNIAGSFLIGLVAAHAARGGFGDPRAALFLATGVCGGFTTFSAFSLQMVGLLQQGEPAAAAVYVLASVAGCGLATAAGLALASAA